MIHKIRAIGPRIAIACLLLAVPAMGDTQLLSEPSPRNGHTAVVRIRDSAGGMGRYHFRITWSIGGGAAPPVMEPPPLVGRPGGRTGWNDNLNFRGRGRGSYSRRGEG